MIIEDNTTGRHQTIANTSKGTTVRSEHGDLLLVCGLYEFDSRTSITGNEGMKHCVNLKTNTIGYFNGTMRVWPVDAKVVVK